MNDVFSSTWVEGKILDLDAFLAMNRERDFSFLLDTNFVIYAREYVTNREVFIKSNPKIACIFQKTLDIINSLDAIIIYHFACEEASRSKNDGNIDSDKYRQLTECLSKIFNRKLPYQIRSTNPLIDACITYSKVPILSSNGLFKSASPITYASILKAYIIKNYDTMLDNKEKTIKYIRFLNEELNVYSSISVTFGIHYFGTSPNILKNVKPKLGYIEVLNRLYAASIDLMMPTIFCQTAEFYSNNIAPIFITFDKGIKLIFDSLSLKGFLNSSDLGYVPVYGFKVFYDSGWKDKDIQEFEALSNKISQYRIEKGINSDLYLGRIFKLGVTKV
jgi:hypothetical protein